jgi:phage shock protein E
VDVRTPEEFAAGHVQGAMNIPLDEIVDRAQELGDGSAPVILYCNSGNRSGQAIARLHRTGVTNLTNGGGLHHMPS